MVELDDRSDAAGHRTRALHRPVVLLVCRSPLPTHLHMRESRRSVYVESDRLLVIELASIGSCTRIARKGGR